MHARIVGILCLLGAAVGPVAADMPVEIRVGVYGPSEAARIVWTCEAVRQRLRATLEHDTGHRTTLIIGVDDDHAEGVADLIEGKVRIGRFLNVEGRWVAHPHARRETLEAWARVLNDLEVEVLTREFERVGARTGRHRRRDLVAALEARYGWCGTGLRLSATSAGNRGSATEDRERAIQTILALPPTAAGPDRHRPDSGGEVEPRAQGRIDADTMAADYRTLVADPPPDVAPGTNRHTTEQILR